LITGLLFGGYVEMNNLIASELDNLRDGFDGSPLYQKSKILKEVEE